MPKRSFDAMRYISKTRVVRLRRKNGVVVQGCDVYIGRRCFMGGWSLDGSKWANPFTISQCGSAGAAVEKYRAYIRARPDLVAAAKSELRGKTLGCWCKPGPCHGDVLKEIADIGAIATTAASSDRAR